MSNEFVKGIRWREEFERVGKKRLKEKMFVIIIRKYCIYVIEFLKESNFKEKKKYLGLYIFKVFIYFGIIIL